VTDALWPFCKIPVLKLPLLAVAVWALGPLLSHWTVSPTWTVIVPGVKLKSAMVTPGSVALRTLAAIKSSFPLIADT
jgi:hypothetical protein